MNKIRTAVIGCGGISQVHLTALSKMDNVELVCVADIKEDRAKARAEAFGCAYTTDWREFITRDDIDVVHICTPHYLHAPMAIALLDAGKIKCLVIPDGYGVGYASVTEVVKGLNSRLYTMKSREEGIKIIYGDDLFSDDVERFLYSYE